MVAALAFGFLALRLGWPPIAGYLLAGVLVGPHTPGFVADQHLADQLAEVGVILLMFGVGLHFHPRDLAAVRGVAITGALVQSAASTALGAWVAHSFGWSWTSGVVFGLALSVASTVVLVRVLSDHGHLHSPAGRVAVGWLVVEDVFTVLALVILPVVFSGSGDLLAASGWAVVKLAAFSALTLVAGARMAPLLLNRVAATASRELFTLSVLALALGIAAGAAFFFGVSMALGAFLAGMTVGQSEFSARAGAEALPMRDAFAVMFFLSVGMLFDPSAAWASWALIAATVAVVAVAKPLVAFLIVVLMGYGSRTALSVAAALGQIGEFSFLLASLGRELEALPASAMNPLVAASMVSIVLNPALYRGAGAVEAWLMNKPRLWKILNRREEAAEAVADPAAHRAVVVGYGPIGRAVTRLLRERGIEPSVIELNVATLRELKEQGIRAVHGDANQESVLRAAGVEGAASLILSSSGAADATGAIRLAREMNRGIHIVSRADYLRQTAALREAGADEVFAGEGELALALTQSLLRDLGATPEQLDEERLRLRAELITGA